VNPSSVTDSPVDQSTRLSALSRAPSAPVKALAESVLAEVEALGTVEVLVNRTGLVMLPYTDNASGVVFHLGEVLVAEAHVRIPTASGEPAQGYGMCLGRDLTQALAIAILDAAATADIQTDAITQLVLAERSRQANEQESLLRAVERTRVEMQTF